MSDPLDENSKPLRSSFGAETPAAAIVRLGEGASTIISDETIVEKQLALASLRPGLRVLEIGVGTGYLAARVAQRVGDPRTAWLSGMAFQWSETNPWRADERVQAMR